MASAFHGRLPWTAFMPPREMSEDKWELYDLRKDYSQSHDLATRYPAKLEELKTLFLKEAEANRMLPLAGQVIDRHGLPDASGGRGEVTYRMGDVGVPEVALPRLVGRSWTMRADLATADHARGVIAAVGGGDAGMALYLDAEGRPTFTYRLFDVKTVTLSAPGPLAPGKHVVQVDFDYAGGGFGKGGALRLSIDGQPVGTGDLPATPISFSIHETFGVGLDTGAPVGVYPKDGGLGYPVVNATINGVTIRQR
jgi:arylsulfatase